MNDLRELIGQKVIAELEDEQGNGIDFKCKVIDLHIEDYDFQYKGECIDILVNVEPIGKLPKGVDPEDLINISLSRIKKYFD
jgi:hypothetical protein